jgi:Derlin-2/3
LDGSALLDQDAFAGVQFGPRAVTTTTATTRSGLLTVRGGARFRGDDEEEDDDDSDEGAYDDEDDGGVVGAFGLDGDDDGDDEYGDDFGDAGSAEGDFAEASTLDRALEAWKKTPPVTKGYLGASFGATLVGYLFHQNQFPPALLLDWNKVLTGQVWRLFTSFLNFGPLGLGYLMTAHFVWTYMATLERLNHNRPYDFWIMIAFGQLSMVVGYPLLNLSPGFLGHNLSTFLVYIWSRYHEGIQVSMFDLFNARAEMLPWFFLGQTFLLEGELPVLDFLGIVFGHIYHHCKTVGILRAPANLVRWYNSDAEWAVRIRELYKPISSDFEMVA